MSPDSEVEILEKSCWIQQRVCPKQEEICEKDFPLKVQRWEEDARNNILETMLYLFLEINYISFDDTDQESMSK